MPDLPVSYTTSYAGQFFKRICTEKPATVRVLRQLYPDGPKCAGCGERITGKRALGTFWRGERTYCKSCDSKFSPSAGTILANSHLTYAQFEVICIMLSLGIEHDRIADMARVHIDTVVSWHQKVLFWESHA